MANKKLFKFSIAAIPNYHKIIGLKQQKYIALSSVPRNPKRSHCARAEESESFPEASICFQLQRPPSVLGSGLPPSAFGPSSIQPRPLGTAISLVLPLLPPSSSCKGPCVCTRPSGVIHDTFLIFRLADQRL